MLLGRVFRNSGTNLNIDQNSIAYGSDHALRMINRMLNLRPFARESGAILTAGGGLL